MRVVLKTALILTVAFIAGCHYNSEEKLYPENADNCDLDNVTFSATIAPLLQANCYACHSNTNAASSGEGIRLQNYADVQVLAKNGKLMGAVKHASGFSAMPKGGNKFSNCDIGKLQKWVDDGILNN